MTDQDIAGASISPTNTTSKPQDIFGHADLLYWQHKYEKAIESYQKILNGPNIKIVDSARCYKSLGAAYAGLKNFEEALNNYHKELDILQKFDGPEKINSIAKCYISIGKIYLLQVDYGTAITWYLRALDLISSITPPSDILTNIHHDLANIYARAQSFDSALIHFEQALALEALKLAEHHPKFGQTYANMGDMYYRQNNYVQALDYFTKAQIIWEKSLPPTHVYLESIKKTIQNVQSKIDVDNEPNQCRQRFFHFEANPSRLLMPIKGYATQPLVSLEEAVKPLTNLLCDIEEKAARAKWKFQIAPADGLTADESAAIFLYTLEWPSKEKSLYNVINSILCNANRDLLKPWYLYLRLLLTALSRLPSWPQTVYRRAKRDLRQEYGTGETIIWWGFSSCTRHLDELTENQLFRASSYRTLFCIESRNGKDIQKYSAYPSEDEILLLPGRQFEVGSCLQQSTDLFLVHLKETKSLVELIEPVSEIDSYPVDTSPIQPQRILNVDKLKMNITPSRVLIPPYPARWKSTAVTVAGGHGRGNGTHQLCCPYGLFVDQNQTVFIADFYNHRIMAWKMDATEGEEVAGGNGQGNRLDQLNGPVDVIVDRETDSLLICDRNNRRVMRWPPHSSSFSVRQGEIVIDNVECSGLKMDDEGSLYVSDMEKHEVRRYDKGGDHKSTVVAGGHGKGAHLNQLNFPTYLFVDAESTLYVSDYCNHRVVKWIKGAKEGIVAAGGNGKGKDLAQLSYPLGVWEDGCEHVYVIDSFNHRVMRWEKGAKQGTVIVGGRGGEKQANQFSSLKGLSFDRHGHLYVADCWNHRVQEFCLIVD